MNVLDIARYVVTKNNEVGDLITNKKLQKILYYIKAWGVVYFKDGIIDEPFEAWVHGPVCVKVYELYKTFSYNPIFEDYKSFPSEYWKQELVKSSRVNSEKMELINAVLLKYGSLSSLQLELLTHSEKPWIEARGGLLPIERGCSVISEHTMRDFYGRKR